MGGRKSPGTLREMGPEIPSGNETMSRMSEITPLISIVIPVKNGAGWLNNTIPAMLKQTLASKTEIIVIDSGSTDDTLSILSNYPVNVIEIEPASFNHGAVRNLGAEKARGTYVVMTVQDAEPADEFWLEHLLDGFDDDKVAGVCGQQIVPHDLDKNPVDWFRPVSPPAKTKHYFADRAKFTALPGPEKKAICSWDDVTAMYRRDILLKNPFPVVSFAEDALWARDALSRGFAIVYNTAAKVKHYHFETPDFTFRRNFTLHYHFYKFFGVKPAWNRNELLGILKNAKLLLMESRLGWKQKWKWLVFNYKQRQAVKRSIEVFNQALARGESELDKIHEELTSIPPQAAMPLYLPSRVIEV